MAELGNWGKGEGVWLGVWVPEGVVLREGW